MPANEPLLAALSLCGATEIYRVGGAQAIAALALGTKSISPVAKLFGPGNAYVVEAKRQAVGPCAIDLLPGPSEVLVIADDSANPEWVASDLLAQAEHGHGSAAILLTPSAALLDAVADPSAAIGRVVPPETLVCRCEEVSRGAIDAALAVATAPNAVKLATRAGMGPCQGRMCEAMLVRMAAARSGRQPDELGGFAARFPIRPVRIGDLVGAVNVAPDATI